MHFHLYWYIVFSILLTPLFWNPTGIRSDRYEQIRMTFRRQPLYVQPRVLEANAPWRCWTRLGLFALGNAYIAKKLLIDPIVPFQAFGWLLMQWLVATLINFLSRRYWYGPDLKTAETMLRTLPGVMPPSTPSVVCMRAKSGEGEEKDREAA